NVFTMVGLSNASSQIIDAMTTGPMTDTTVMPGTNMQWMALKRAGRADVLRNVRWAGAQSFDAWKFSVTSGGHQYTLGGSEDRRQLFAVVADPGAGGARAAGAAASAAATTSAAAAPGTGAAASTAAAAAAATATAATRCQVVPAVDGCGIRRHG